LSPSREPDLEQWEDPVEVDIRENTKIPAAERNAIIQARVGQGRFRANVHGVERACRVTNVERLDHLIARHNQAVAGGTNGERLDGGKEGSC
jgi:hypothetical protein